MCDSRWLCIESKQQELTSVPSCSRAFVFGFAERAGVSGLHYRAAPCIKGPITKGVLLCVLCLLCVRAPVSSTCLSFSHSTFSLSLSFSLSRPSSTAAGQTAPSNMGPSSSSQSLPKCSKIFAEEDVVARNVRAKTTKVAMVCNPPPLAHGPPRQ